MTQAREGGEGKAASHGFRGQCHEWGCKAPRKTPIRVQVPEGFLVAKNKPRLTQKGG